MPHKGKNGFATLPIVIIVGIVIAIGIFFLLSPEKTQESNNRKVSTKNMFEKCPEQMVFDHPPVNLEKTKVVVPLGLMTGSHVTPIDHQYFQDFDNTEANIEVYSPEAGTITEIQFMSGTRIEGSQTIDWQDYRLVIDHGCGVSSAYIHIDKITDKIAKEAPRRPGYKSLNIPVDAGEIIGWYQKNVDYNVVDESVTLDGFVVPEHYEREPWKIHVPDTLNYFNQEIVDKMIAKSLRSSPPYAGKFDWDIDGKLQGNWFEEGTNYYQGNVKDAYWRTHLSISPNYLDYDHFIISMGNYDGREEQFAIKNNSPDPASVSPETGLVKYELVSYDYITTDGDMWERTKFAKIDHATNYDHVQGVVLVQMLDDRKLKFEVFPGQTADQINSFTQNAKIFVR